MNPVKEKKEAKEKNQVKGMNQMKEAKEMRISLTLGTTVSRYNLL